MKRRLGLLAGALAVAGVTAVGWRAWRRAAASGAAGDASALWRTRLPRPDGTELAFAALLGHPLVVNFWATWCPPCIEEMPALDRFARDFRPQGWRVVGVAVDQPAAVRDFLDRSPVAYDIGVAGPEGATLARALGNTRGGLPFTVVIDRQGRLARGHLGQTRYDELAAWARGA